MANQGLLNLAYTHLGPLGQKSGMIYRLTLEKLPIYKHSNLYLKRGTVNHANATHAGNYKHYGIYKVTLPT